jgi:hypothetical protein
MPEIAKITEIIKIIKASIGDTLEKEIIKKNLVEEAKAEVEAEVEVVVVVITRKNHTRKRVIKEVNQEVRKEAEVAAKAAMVTRERKIKEAGASQIINVNSHIIFDYIDAKIHAVNHCCIFT